MTSTDPARLSWLLLGLLERTAGARHAVLVAADGLPICHASHPRLADAERLGADAVDRLAAVAAGFQGLAIAVSVEHGDGRAGVRRSMTEYGGGILFLIEAGAGAHLAVLAEEDADAGVVGFHLAELVDQLADHLTAAPRSPGVGVP